MTSLLSFSKAKQGGQKGWVTDSRSYRGCSQFTLTTSRRNADWLQEKEPARGGDEKSQVPRNHTEMPCLKGNSSNLSFELKKILNPVFIWKQAGGSEGIQTGTRLFKSHCSEAFNPSCFSHFKRQKSSPLKCLQVVWKPFQREAQRTSLPSTFLEIKDLCIIYTTSKGSTSKQWPINQ